jgi:hypothetical protein
MGTALKKVSRHDRPRGRFGAHALAVSRLALISGALRATTAEVCLGGLCAAAGTMLGALGGIAFSRRPGEG